MKSNNSCNNNSYSNNNNNNSNNGINHRYEILESFFIKLSNSVRPEIVSPIVPKVLYFLLFYLFGGSRSFVPLFLTRQLGMDTKILGFILLFPPFISFIFSPIWSGIADTHNAHKLVFFSMVAGTGFCYFLLNFINNYYIATIIIFINAVFWAPIIPLADSTTYKILGEPYKELYGKQRLYGSVGFSVSALFTGLLVSIFNGNVRVAWINYPIAAILLLLFTYLFFNNNPISNVYTKLNGGGGEESLNIINHNSQSSTTTTLNNSDITEGNQDSDDLGEEQDQQYEQDNKEEEEEDSLATPSSILLSSPNLGSGTDDYDTEELELELVERNKKQNKKYHLLNNSNSNNNSNNNNSNHKVDMNLKKEEIKISIQETQEKIPFIKGVRILVSNSKILIILFNSIIIACGMSVCNNYLALAITDEKYFNGPYTLVGIGSVLNVTFEVVFFFFGKQLLLKIGIFKLVCISHIAVTVRVIAYTIILRMHWSAWSIVPVELLHGVCFASIWNSGSTIINNNSPPGLSATGQSLFFGVYMGLGTGLGALFGGYLYDYGAITMFEFVAAIVTFGFIVFLITEFLLNKRLNNSSNNSSIKNNSSNSDNRNNNSNDSGEVEMIEKTTHNGSGKNNNSNNNIHKEININNSLITKNKSLDNIILSKTNHKIPLTEDDEYNDEEESLKFNQLLKEQLEREREREKEQKLLEEEEEFTYNQLESINNHSNDIELPLN